MDFGNFDYFTYDEEKDRASYIRMLERANDRMQGELVALKRIKTNSSIYETDPGIKRIKDENALFKKQLAETKRLLGEANKRIAFLQNQLGESDKENQKLRDILVSKILTQAVGGEV